MKRLLFTTGRLLLSIGLLCLLAAFAASTGYGAAKRGDAPRCQEQCLADHQVQLEKLIKEFEGKRNKFEFQDHVEDAVRKYGQCVENCREPQPVK